MKYFTWSLIGALVTGTSGCTEMPDSEPEESGSNGLATTAHGLTREQTFTAFESGQVRPLALSRDRKYVFAVNTPDNRLEIFRVDRETLRPAGSVMVGMEPVAIAVRSSDEVWVVNHLSDSISVVDVSSPSRPRVKRTLLVGDEPRDIVFAGDRAYITAAHRGQNTGRNPQLTTPGVGRADVWVFNANAPGETLTGTPITVITLFADTPRALAVSNDQRTVYVAAFNSGNRTTVVPERIVTNFGGALPPSANRFGVLAPAPALIAKYRAGGPDGQPHWLDEQERVWDEHVRFNLPDKDVFAIDATSAVPAEKVGAGTTGVGTTLFNMAVNPVNGKIYVSNLESRNEVRFEGHNVFGGGSSMRGRAAENRITVIEGLRVAPRHLNKHVDYAREGTPTEAAQSLAFPTGMQVSADGRWLYVAALGSAKLGVFSTAELEADSFVPSASNHVRLSGGGPTGLVLDSATNLAYVLTRFDNGISVVNTKRKIEVGHVRMYDAEPVSITRGRRLLYDAAFSSARGDSACASCHVFGDTDHLAWDLGDPDAAVLKSPGPFITRPELDPLVDKNFHPMKGPMVTQSLRGLANHGPMHWRGDRTGGNDVAESAQPDTGTFDERAAFKKFAVGFPALLGRAATPTDEEMQVFADFILQLTYPPNPIRNLDNSLTAEQAAGKAFYFNKTAEGAELPVDGLRNCNGCHRLDPAGNAEFGVSRPGFFGSDGSYSFENAPQFMKVPHLRNAYQKVGMFGVPDTFDLPIDRPLPLPPIGASLPPPLNDVSFMGDQIRGFGFSHAGDLDTLYRVVGSVALSARPPEHAFPNPFGIPPDGDGIVIRRNLEAFILAYDSNLAPIVGQQATLTTRNAPTANPRIALMKTRASAGECELVVRGVTDGVERGFLYRPGSNAYTTHRPGAAAITEAQLRALLPSTPLTYTAVPPGSGRRMALDRNSDGVLDGAR
ncbi:MAG TPA: beta-propeller fold lactonase family protein [Polyangiaceae bacterium]